MDLTLLKYANGLLGAIEVCIGQKLTISKDIIFRKLLLEMPFQHPPKMKASHVTMLLTLTLNLTILIIFLCHMCMCVVYYDPKLSHVLIAEPVP